MWHRRVLNNNDFDYSCLVHREIWCLCGRLLATLDMTTIANEMEYHFWCAQHTRAHTHCKCGFVCRMKFETMAHHTMRMNRLKKGETRKMENVATVVSRVGGDCNFVRFGGFLREQKLISVQHSCRWRMNIEYRNMKQIVSERLNLIGKIHFFAIRNPSDEPSYIYNHPESWPTCDSSKAFPNSIAITNRIELCLVSTDPNVVQFDANRFDRYMMEFTLDNTQYTMTAMRSKTTSNSSRFLGRILVWPSTNTFLIQNV